MRPFFEGWYYKQQFNGKTLAVIPGRSDDGAFIQVITDNNSYFIPYNISEYKKDRTLQIGENYFSDSGIILKVKHNDISIYGELKYSGLIPIQGDIMGFFRFFPMECRHGIISMKHDVSGEIILNGEKYDFNNGTGYIETDSGYSFPESYSWVHSNDFKAECSITAAIAKIPFAGFNFWGCICVVWLNGKEYRLATYKGAKILRCENGMMEIKQGKYNLTVNVNRQHAQNLPAPKSGLMKRVIKESASCPADFLFTENGRVVFSGESKNTSYEFEMDIGIKGKT